MELYIPKLKISLSRNAKEFFKKFLDETVSYRQRIFVLNEEAIPANTKRATKFGFLVFDGKNKIFFFHNLLKIHHSALQKKKSGNVRVKNRKRVSTVFFENRCIFIPLFR